MWFVDLLAGTVRSQIAETTGAEGADVGELAGMLAEHLERLSAAHGEPRERPVLLRVRDVVRVAHGRDEVVEQLGREVLHVAVAHHDDHVGETAGEAQVVEDLLGPADIDPVAVALATAVLQEQRRVGSAVGAYSRAASRRGADRSPPVTSLW